MTREAFPRDIAGVRWLRTGDLGFRRNEELFVTGRVKELIVIRGRNISPQDVEASVQGADERFRPGFGVAFSVEREGAERLVVVQEVRRPRRGDLTSLDAKVRAAVLRDHGVELHQIVLVEPHTIPRTPNGKLRRLACRDAFLADGLGKISMEPVYG
jgi:acyl-CoA synthetase (AMP-forming)/AMP-acid ligase II